MFKILEYMDKDVSFYIQPIGKDVHLHCYVYRWKLSVLKNMYIQFGKTISRLKEGGYEYLVTITKNPKFAHLMGGRTIRNVNFNNEEYEVVVWELQK